MLNRAVSRVLILISLHRHDWLNDGPQSAPLSELWFLLEENSLGDKPDTSLGHVKDENIYFYLIFSFWFGSFFMVCRRYLCRVYSHTYNGTIYSDTLNDKNCLLHQMKCTILELEKLRSLQARLVHLVPSNELWCILLWTDVLQNMFVLF